MQPGFSKSDHEFNDYYGKKARNEDRWINQTIYTPNHTKLSHVDVEWKKEKDSRPVNPNFNHVKGYKYDVEVPWEEKYPYLADRLGHPEILGTPIERLMRLESDIYHPSFLDQPFV